MQLGARIERKLEDLGISQSELARRAGVPQTTINSIIRLNRRSSPHLMKLARALQTTPEYLLGETEDARPIPEFDVLEMLALNKKIEAELATRANTDDDTVEIAVINEGYGMGGTFIDENTLTVEKRRFSRAWLRDFTDSPPDLLFVTSGIGDSMMPTIHDRDGILVDRGDNRLRGGDRLWAVSFAGTEMIKRLRPRPDGSVIIMSDNKDVSDDVATDGELFIVGRVAAIMRKV